jgi:hypothetical protein
MHPTDWQSIRLLKDTNGQYYGGGPFGFAAYGNPGQAAGDTTNLAAGTDTLWNCASWSPRPSRRAPPWLAPSSSRRRSTAARDIRVEMTNSNEDDFLKNLIAIRVEERLGLAVYRPAGFGTVTGL